MPTTRRARDAFCAFFQAIAAYDVRENETMGGSAAPSIFKNVFQRSQQRNSICYNSYDGIHGIYHTLPLGYCNGI